MLNELTYGKFPNLGLFNMETKPQSLVLGLLVCPVVKMHQSMCLSLVPTDESPHDTITKCKHCVNSHTVPLNRKGEELGKEGAGLQNTTPSSTDSTFIEDESHNPGCASLKRVGHLRAGHMNSIPHPVWASDQKAVCAREGEGGGGRLS